MSIICHSGLDPESRGVVRCGIGNLISKTMNDRQNKNLPFYFGPPLERPFAAVLNSRQSKTPRGAERWIENTVAAVE